MRALKSIAWLMVPLAVVGRPSPLRAQEPRPNSAQPASPASKPPDTAKPDTTPKSVDELVGELL